MLKKENRLKSHSAFLGTYNQRQILCGNFFKIYLGKKQIDLTNSVKIGFVVSTKVHKRSVVRNRIKRYLRESVRLILKNNSTLSSKLNQFMSLVIVAKNQAIFASFEDINNEILDFFNRIN